MSDRVPDSAPPSALPGLGPKSERALAEVGVENVGQLREIGYLDAWHRLKFMDPGWNHLAGLYALYGALNNLPWIAVARDEALKARLKAEAGK